MKSKAKPMENFVTAWDAWLVNGMCLVASYLWGWMCDLLCYRRRHRASTLPAFKVFTLHRAVQHHVKSFGYTVNYAAKYCIKQVQENII